MKEIVKVDILSFGKIQALLMTVFGFVFGLIYGVIFAIALPAPMNWIAAGGFILGIPVLFGIFGFICGLLCALVYNFLAEKVGGIKVEVR